MIETEDQRRWWFATHPDYSWSHRGIKGSKPAKNDNKVDPKEVDAYVDRALKYETGPVADLLRSVKRNFGTEAESSHPDSPSGKPNADRDSHNQPEISREELEEDLKRWREAIELDKKGLIADPHTLLDILPYRRLITSPIQALKYALRRMAQDQVVSAVKKAGTEGPGKWVEVARSRFGLEHQSKMSGQKITERGGKQYIKEYELNGVKFDDYKDGKLYEYKKRQGNLLNRDGEFPDWARAKREAQDQAARQIKAARGIPIVWRVGADQVKAYEKAVGEVSGIIIIP
jgi:hypothetical protein